MIVGVYTDHCTHHKYNGDVVIDFDNGMIDYQELLSIVDCIVAESPPDWLTDYCQKYNIPIYSKYHQIERSETGSLYPIQVASFRSTAGMLARLHIRKNDDYGVNNLIGLGQFGILVRIFDKVSRLLNLLGVKIEVKFLSIEQPRNPKNEAISDSYLDLASYAILGRLLEQNLLCK